jgi:FKBP-type peptidyl-prolyl cis-trans isomerase FklB
MKQICFSAGLLLCLMGSACAQKKAVATAKAKPAAVPVPTNVSTNIQNNKVYTKMDSISYGLGVLIGKNLKSQGFTDLNIAEFTKGFEDMLKGNALKITPEQANDMVSMYAQQAQQGAGKVNLEAGQKFLADNKVRPGIITLPSGLQYEIIKDGTGASPKATDKVTTHYHGTLIDGKVFDSSVQRGEPIEFPVNGVIRGWTEALQLMKVGSKWKLYIPYNLAYGERGAGAEIKPYSALVFDVELLKIN